MDASAPADPPAEGRVRITRAGVRRGCVAALPLLLAVGPFGFIFGIVATERGLDLAQTMVMTATVIAGASQLATVQLVTDGAPVLLAVFAGAVVNLRIAMYSASLAVWWQGVPLGMRLLVAPVLHDQSYALAVQRYQRKVEPLGDRVGFYLGIGLLTATTWTAATWAGATLGERLLGGEIDIGFMVPVTFIALVAPMLRGRAVVTAAAVAAGTALAVHWLPYGLGLTVGAAAGIAAGMAFGREAA